LPVLTTADSKQQSDPGAESRGAARS